MPALYHHDRTPSTSGIYRITCVPTGKFYIGSALNLRQRLQSHRNDLHRNEHHSITLQRAWNKYGADAFTFEVLELVLFPELLTAREQFYLDTLKPFGKHGFNTVRIAGSQLGYRHTPETCKKMSKSHLGIPLRPETCQKLSEVNKNRPPVSKETCEKIRKAKLNHEVSPETRTKISATKTGHTYAPGVYAGRMKTLIVTAPDGTEYVVTGVKRFCREHNLDCSSLMRTAKGLDRGTVCTQHKGYRARFPEPQAS